MFLHYSTSREVEILKKAMAVAALLALLASGSGIAQVSASATTTATSTPPSTQQNATSTSPQTQNATSTGSGGSDNSSTGSGGSGGTNNQGGAVVTGNAGSSGTIVNQSNTSNTNTNTGTSTTSSSTGTSTASSTPPSSSTGTTTPQTTGDTGTTTVSNTNNATTTNHADVDAKTGENKVEGDGESVIATGHAAAEANVLNVVNTNIFNSQGLFLFLSNLFGGGGDLDFRDFNVFSPQNSDSCPEKCGENENTVLKNQNSAKIENNVSVSAQTGGNVTSGNGTSTIATGNAYASANVINVANTNIVDSNYLLLTFNNFGAWGGDVVLPAKGLFRQLFGSGAGVQGNTSVSNNNEAAVGNNVEVGAETGDNESAKDGGGNAIGTGNAGSAANVVNKVNTNIFGSDSFTILFRIHGEWDGEVFGAPEGLKWLETGSGGIQLRFEEVPEGDSPKGTTTAQTQNGGGGEGGGLSLINGNTAAVDNNISVLALTGKNKIKGEGGDGAVVSGDAYASANVINVVNSNVIGRNWLLAIVNVFGDWTGDLAFGRPDLWLGSSVELPEGSAKAGKKVTYRFTIKNNGDADATAVRLKHVGNHKWLSFLKDTPVDSNDPNERIWNIGTIPAGKTIEFAYDARIADNLPFGETVIPAEFYLSSKEKDEYLFDNSDTLTLFAQRPEHYTGIGTNKVHVTKPPSYDVEVSNNSKGSRLLGEEGTMVDYQIKIKNNGGSGYNTVVVDKLYNGEGTLVHKEAWDLGEVYPDEEITLSYTAAFNGHTNGGVYTNKVQVFSLAGHEEVLFGWHIDPTTATTSLELVEPRYPIITPDEPEGGEGEEEETEDEPEVQAAAEGEGEELAVHTPSESASEAEYKRGYQTAFPQTLIPGYEPATPLDFLYWLAKSRGKTPAPLSLAR